MADATAQVDGGGSGRLDAIADAPLYVAPADIDMGATYATGGNPLVLGEDLDGWLVRDVLLVNRFDGTRYWDYDPVNQKFVAHDAFNTEEGNGADVSAVSLRAYLILTR